MIITTFQIYIHNIHIYILSAHLLVSCENRFSKFLVYTIFEPVVNPTYLACNFNYTLSLACMCL